MGGRALLAAVLALALWVPAASAAPGQPDPSFGSAGTARPLPASLTTHLAAVATQSDGKVVLAGSEAPGSVILIRLLENGALDPSFGAGGKVTTPFTGFGGAEAVLIAPDGRIVIAGSAKGAVNAEFLVARYLANGALDPSFGGGDGIVQVPVGVGDAEARAVALGAGGRILATGDAKVPTDKDAMGVVVLLADGSLDPTFNAGAPGLYTTDPGFDGGVAVAGLPDGRILLGNANGSGRGVGFTLQRLLPSGVGDPSFGGDGSVETPIPGVGMAKGAGRVTDLALRPDGRIVASGYGVDMVGEPPQARNKWAAVGYLVNGDLDPSFGTGGIFARRMSAGESQADAVRLAPSGRVLLSGAYDVESGESAIAALGLDPAGALDPSFGSGGEFLRGPGAPFGDIFAGAALDPYERLVILSTAYIGNNYTEPVVIRLGDPLPPAPANAAPRARMKKVPRKVKADKLRRFSGTASDADGSVARVQIAVERKRLDRPARPGARSRPSLLPRFCWQMSNARGKFKRVRAGRRGTKAPCPRRWLTAKGTAKWNFKLKKRLPPGRYVVYARAVDSAGLAQSTFSRKAGNRYAFRVLPAK